MSLKFNTSKKINKHTHNLSEGQLICDNEQCREKVFEKLQQINNEIKLNDFNRIIQTEQIGNTQGWNIICLISKTLSEKLVKMFNNEEIHKVIEDFIKKDTTKQAFDKAFNEENQHKLDEFITKEQLWNIYMKLCIDAVKLLSKSKTERRNHIANFLVFDQ